MTSHFKPLRLIVPYSPGGTNDMGADIDIKTPDEMRKIIPVEIEKWTKVAIAAGMPRE